MIGNTDSDVPSSALRILYVGDLTPRTRCEQRARTLVEQGHRLTTISFAPIGDDPAAPEHLGLSARVLRRLGRPLDPESANAKVIDAIASERYDVVWVEKALCLHERTLQHVHRKQPQAKLIFFSEDDMALRHNQSAYFRACVPHYDLVVTTKRRNLTLGQLQNLGAREVHYEPKTYDPEFHRPLELRPGDVERFGSPIGLCGTYEAERAASCVALAESGLPVRVFGNGWHRFRGSAPANLQIELRPVGGEDYVRALNATSVNLGFLRHASLDEHTDRTVEIPAAGGFMLAERSSEHLQLFKENAEASFFDSDEELIERAKWALEHPAERQAIAAAGRRRCLESGYEHAGALSRILHRSDALRVHSLKEAA